MKTMTRTIRAALPVVLTVLTAAVATPVFGQAPPSYPPGQLDQLVSRIALYPDPLLSQVLAAATFPDQVPDAAGWADQHHYLTGDALASAISADQLPWDPSVQALLPFPSVLDMMASDMNWTTDLGNAFLAQQADVMDAVQRMRQKARDFGYLQTNAQIVVGGGPYITIAPVDPYAIWIPYYDPAVVFLAPRPGFAIGAAIGFRFGVTLGAAFRPWGWGVNRFDWGSHALFVNNARWGRTWVNRRTYVHPSEVRRYTAPRPAERHEVHERTPREREAARTGRERVEEHKEEHRR